MKCVKEIVWFCVVLCTAGSLPLNSFPDTTGIEGAPGWSLVESRALGAGYYGAKCINPETEIQVPVVLDAGILSRFPHGSVVDEGDGWWILHEGAHSTSAPFRAGSGRIAFTVDDRMILLDNDFSTRHGRGEVSNQFSLDLGCQVQRVSFSPGFEAAVFSDFDTGSVKVVNLRTGAVTPVIERFEGIPEWSPDGAFIAVTNTNSGVRIIDISEDYAAGGMDVFFTLPSREYGHNLFGPSEWKSPADGTGVLEVPVRLTTGKAEEAKGILVIDPARLIDSGPVIDVTGPISGEEIEGVGFRAHTPEEAQPSPLSSLFERIVLRFPGAPENAPASVVARTVSGVPYIHQLYDTPDWFDGNWACGPTSCLMAVQKYRKLPYWLCRASWPYGHASLWGNYISGQFTHNSVTYSTVSWDPSGRPARGLYGYICPDGSAWWSRMNSFMQWAGCTTYYDSSPLWSELTAQLDAGRPVVMSTMLTDYGHIVTAIGYYSNHSVLVRDPYGNKAHGYPNYESEAVYDWPGYNNGNYNLTSVSLLIGVSGSTGGLVAIVDDGTSTVPNCRFGKHGPYEWWWESDYYGTGSPGAVHSYTNGMFYTYSEQSGDWTNWVHWGVNLPEAGYYKFEVFIPQNLATTTNAEYYHYYPGTGMTLLSSVNQNAYYDEWVTLSSSRYCQRGWNYILLGDVTGESGATMIGVDAIRVTRR